jgi:hypothetical protein
MILQSNYRNLYEAWIASGNIGSLNDFFNSLKGPKGDTVIGPSGVKGDQGTQGLNGANAYQLALQSGFVGTLTEWKASLVGHGIASTYTKSQVLSFPTTDYNTLPSVLLTSGDDGGLFTLDSADTTSLNDGGVVLVTAGGFRYKRNIIDNKINVKWFGAKGTGLVDDSPAIQAAVDYAKFIITLNGGNVRRTVYFPAGIYNVNTVINCTNITGLLLQGEGSSYVSTHINGITGGAIFDFSGGIM